MVIAKGHLLLFVLYSPLKHRCSEKTRTAVVHSCLLYIRIKYVHMHVSTCGCSCD